MQHIVFENYEVAIMDASLLQDHEAFVTDAVVEECVRMVERLLAVEKLAFPEFECAEIDTVKLKVFDAPSNSDIEFVVDIYACCAARQALGGAVRIELEYGADRSGKIIAKRALGNVTELDEFSGLQTGVFSYTFEFIAPEEVNVTKDAKFLKVFLGDVWQQ